MTGSPAQGGSPAPGASAGAGNGASTGAGDPPALRLGTRASALALAQSGMAAAALTAATGRAVELVHITTFGDTSREALSKIGGTGVFVNALRDALLAGDIDFAVHSLKDLPTAEPEGLYLAAVSERAAVNDVLVARDGAKFADLPPGARVGTGAARRMALVRMLRPDLEVVPIRGNVDTRVNLVRTGRLDAVVLALAGLQRLGRQDEATEVFGPEVMLPSPGQGALAIECRDPALVPVLAVLDDPATRAAVTAERSLLAVLEAGCSAPVGAHAVAVDDNVLVLTGVVATVSGSRSLRLSATGRVDRAAELGRELAERLLAEGAAELMESAE